MGRLWRFGRQHSRPWAGHLDCNRQTRHYLCIMDTVFDPLALDNADDFIAVALQRLARGVHDRRHAFRTISLASCGLDGTPQLRAVVLRGYDSQAPAVTFHTDQRSPKFSELTKSPQAAALAYDPAAKLQIRLNGVVVLHHNDDIATKTWAAMQATSRACYHLPNRPGSMPRETEGLSESQALANFCVCRLTISQIDVLYLRAAGHLRARMDNPASGAPAYWVAP